MKKISLFTLAFVFGVASVSFAADNESWIQKIKNRFQKKDTAVAGKPTPVQDAKKTEAPKKQRKDMTKGELAADIEKNLDREGSILNMIPGLEKKTDPGGKDYYTYQGARLEDVDKDTLGKIFGRVRNEALRIRTDKMNRQIETVRRANAAAGTVPQVPKPPVLPPKVVTPPQSVKSFQQPPKQPPMPPAPQRR